MAAQGILDKPDGGHRIIHDGTHGVQLNNEINITDRLENLGPRELAAIMNLSVAAVNADVAKAHRRLKVREDDWGVLACKTSGSSESIWLNKTGIFGVASAAYWWSRLMGLVGRFALNVMLDDWFFALIFVDGERRGENCAELLASLVAVEVLPIETLRTGAVRSHLLHCGGGTDNKAAGSLSVQKLSTKLPVMVWLMEYLSQCESMNIRCKLNWRPRETNVEADDLTN